MNTIKPIRKIVAAGGAGLALLLSAMSMPAAGADKIGGSAKVDFTTTELTIPCVKVSNSGGSADGKYFDVVLKRRGSSQNYELSSAEVEDPVFCQKVADYANYLDDNLDSPEASAILVQCATTSTRAMASVNGAKLPAGSYSAEITSGANKATSPVRAAVSGEVAYDFDSNAAAVSAGAVSIAPNFVTGGTVTAKIINDATLATVLTKTATCSAGN